MDDAFRIIAVIAVSVVGTVGVALLLRQVLIWFGIEVSFTDGDGDGDGGD